MRDPQCKAIYQERRETLLKIGETKKIEEALADRSRSIREMSEQQAGHLSEVLALAEKKTREYLGREVQLERPSLQILIPPSPA